MCLPLILLHCYLAPGEWSSGEDVDASNCRHAISGGGHIKQILFKGTGKKHDIRLGKRHDMSSHCKTPQQLEAVLLPLLKRIAE